MPLPVFMLIDRQGRQSSAAVLQQGAARNLRQHCVGNAEVSLNQLPAPGQPLAGVQAQLGADEGHRNVRHHRLVRRRAGVRIHAAGHVHRQHRAIGAVYPRHRFPERWPQRAAQASAQQRIDNDGASDFLALVGRSDASVRCPGLRQRRVSLEDVAANPQHLHIQANLTGQAGDDVAIPSVVPLAAEDGDGAGARPAVDKSVKGRLTGTAHKCKAGNPLLLDHKAVELAALGAGVQDGHGSAL